MPTSLLGLVLFVALLTPGFTYLAARDRLMAVRQLSALRETATVATVSIGADLSAFLVFAAVRGIWPDATPDVGRLVRDGGPYIEQHYLSFGLTGIALLGGATAVAGIAGHAMGTRGSGDSRPIEWMSGWSKAFTLEPDTYKVLHCELLDGTVISGSLLSFSPQLEETSDRSLVLTAPLTIRSPESNELQPWPNGAVVLSAAQIKHVAVAYLDENPTGPGQSD